MASDIFFEDAISFSSNIEANSKRSLNKIRLSARDPELNAPISPVNATSGIPLTLRLPSSSKNDAMPLKGSQLKSGSVIAEVTPFDLFQGINVEFGFIAS